MVGCSLSGQELLDGTTFASPWWSLLPLSERDKEEMLKQFSYSLTLLQRDAQRVRSTKQPEQPLNPLLCRFEAVDASHPLLCSIRLTAWRHWDKLLFLTLLWSLLSYAYYRVQRWRQHRQAHLPLVKEVQQRIRSVAGEPVVIDHLRDDLWFKGDLAVWQRVVEDIDRDTRVELAKVRAGNVMREAWRWVGKPPPPQQRQPPPASSATSSPPPSLPPLPDAASSLPPPALLFATQPSVAPALFGSDFGRLAEDGGASHARRGAAPSASPVQPGDDANPIAASLFSKCAIS